LTVQSGLLDVSVCVLVELSNSKRTVSPVWIVTFGGDQAGAGESTASTTTVSAKAVPAPRVPANTATATASSVDRSVRMSNGSPPLIPPTTRTYFK
jgi:hypothetical protein